MTTTARTQGESSSMTTSITLNGIEYVPAAEAPEPSPIRIVILQRGWVYIGRFSREGDECALVNAHCIRRWGTTMGLGQLARDGKQAETVLEPTGVVRFHALTMVAAIDCEVAKWSAL